jgi:hypothetical protein
MHNLSPKQASVFKDCYSVLLKNAEGGGDLKDNNKLMKNQNLSAAAVAAAQKKFNNNKRKRKDLKITTVCGLGTVTGAEAGILLPDTPRRVLHTQLLLQLLSNGGEDPMSLNMHHQHYAKMDAQGNGKRSKKRASKNSTHFSVSMLPSKAHHGDMTHGEHMEEQPFHDVVDGSFHTFEQLDIDFNEVSLFYLCICIVCMYMTLTDFSSKLLNFSICQHQMVCTLHTVCVVLHVLPRQQTFLNKTITNLHLMIWISLLKWKLLHLTS